jgi:carboxylesterase type B
MESKFRKVLARLQCRDVACLLEVPAEELLSASLGTNWRPVIDGVDLPKWHRALAARGQLAPVPVIVGSVMEDINRKGTNCDPAACTEEDFVAWMQQKWGVNQSEAQRAAEIYSDERPRPGGNATQWYFAELRAGADNWAGCSGRRVARWVEAAGQKAYRFYWTYAPAGRPYPAVAFHAADQPFIFHVLSETPEQMSDPNGGTYHIEPHEVDFSHQLVQYWASFAADGRPQSRTAWPAYESVSDLTLVIGADPSGENASTAFGVASGVRAARCDFWDNHVEDAGPTSLSAPSAAVVV